MSTRAPGRPRSEAARRAIVTATLALVNEQGYAAVTMEGIARRAQVSKQTIYRWWSSPAEIVLETINAGAERAAPLPDTGAFGDDLRVFVRRSVDGAARSTKLLTALMAEAQRNSEFAAAFRNGFLGRRRGVLYELLGDALSRGVIHPGIDLNVITETFFGALWYRILADTGPLDLQFADGLTSVLLSLIDSAAVDIDS